MKQCTYCGKEYPDEASICFIDEHPLQDVSQKVSSGSENRALTIEEKKGYLILAFLFGICLSIEFIRILTFDPRYPGVFLFADFIRCALTFALFYAVWIGKEWAKSLTTFLFLLSWVFSIYAIFVQPTFVHFIESLFTIVSFTTLAFSKNINAFLNYQKKRRTPTTPR